MSDSMVFDQHKSDSFVEELAEDLDIDITTEVFRSDRVDELWKLTAEGFEPLAWTPNIRYLFYNEERGILIHDIEGDLYVWKDPSVEIIGEQVEKYPKMEVSVGEKYDSRFDRGCR